MIIHSSKRQANRQDYYIFTRNRDIYLTNYVITCPQKPEVARGEDLIRKWGQCLGRILKWLKGHLNGLFIMQIKRRLGKRE